MEMTDILPCGLDQEYANRRRNGESLFKLERLLRACLVYSLTLMVPLVQVWGLCAW